MTALKLKILKVDTASIRWISDCEYVLKNYIQKNKAEEKSIE
jgi:hypothetical protein